MISFRYLFGNGGYMNSVYMCYYEHLAKLARVANKQTLFLAHLLYRMNWDAISQQMVVSLSPFDKRAIMKIITPDCKDHSRLASQYLLKICQAGLIKSIGGGAYLIDPQSFGGHKYIKKDIRSKNGLIYETRVFSEENEKEVTAYIITEDGERIDLS